MRFISDYLQSNEVLESKAKSQSKVRAKSFPWKPPPDGIWKVNVNVAWKEGEGNSGFGLVCRSSDGNLLGASSIFSEIEVHPPMVELMAILEGLKFAE